MTINYGRGGQSRGLAKMRYITKAATDQLKITITEKNISYAFHGEAMQNIRAGYIQYVNAMAQAEKGGMGFQKFAHLYELEHEGEDEYRLFDVMARKSAKRPSLNIFVRRARMVTPLTDWQKRAQDYTGVPFSRHTFYNRPLVVEEGRTVDIIPTKHHGFLIPGEQKKPRYADLRFKFMNPVHIDYSEYLSYHALEKSMIEFSKLYSSRIVHGWGTKYVKANIKKAIIDARAASYRV